MTREEAQSCIKTIELLRRLAYNIHGVMDVIDAGNCEKIIEALSREPSEDVRCSEIPNSSDTISRQAAIDAMGKAKWAKERLEQLPPAQPEQKRGKWIYNSPVTMKCDQCGFAIKDWDWHRFKICPNCGADMRGGDNT